MKKLLTATLLAFFAIVMFTVSMVTPAVAAQSTGFTKISVKLVKDLTAGEQAAVIRRNGGRQKQFNSPNAAMQASKKANAHSAVITPRGRMALAAPSLLSLSVPDHELPLIMQNYQNDPQVESVEIVKRRNAQGLSSDLNAGVQWSLTAIGWDKVFGAVTPQGSATVAVLDTGVAAAHADLNRNIVAGTSVLDGSAGQSDPSGHGTQMAGIVAAVTDNNRGIAGVAYGGVKIQPVTVLDKDGLGWDDDIISGIIWAADNGADVILMGFSSADYSQHLQDAIDYAWEKGAVLVAATGNDGSSTPTFPAGNRGVIGVSATDQNDLLANFSNYGKNVFVAAPGTDIYTTSLNNNYSYFSGTSPAASVVAGVAAFMKAVDTTLTNGIIANRLAASADRIGNTNDPATAEKFGNGRVNMASALKDKTSGIVEPAGVGGSGGGTVTGPYLSAAHTYDTKIRFIGNTNPLTQNYTVVSGGTLLVVSIVTQGNVARTGGAPTYNGIALTQADQNRGATETVTELWYLTTPPNGVSYPLLIPNSNSRNLYAIASSYKAQAGYTSALDTAVGNTGTTANPSIAVTTTVDGDIIVSGMGNGRGTAPTGRTGTVLYETDNGNFSDNGQYLVKVTAGAQTMSWTVGSDDWGMVVAAFKEVAMPAATVVGTATAYAASSTSITVSMPYAQDGNGNNTYTVDYKLSTGSSWTNVVTAAAHTASPYTTTITGLTAGKSYDVRLRYNDSDGVTGTNPQFITVMAPLDAFPATPQLSATSGNLSGSFSVSPDDKRLLLVLVSCFDSGGSSGQTFSATYGGKPLSGAYLQNSNSRQTWIGYLTESDIASRSGDTVAVTVTGTHTNVYAYIASYSGIDQATPITAAGGAYVNNTNNVAIGGPLAVNAGGYGVYVWSGSSGRTRTSDSESYGEQSDYAATGINTGVATKYISSTGTTNPTVTWSGNNRVSVSFVTLNHAPARIDQATLTVTGPASITYGSTGTITTSGGSGSGALAYSHGLSTGCTVNAGSGVISVTNASGTCTVTASKAADSSYNVATSAGFSVTLSKTTSTVAITGPTSFTYSGSPQGPDSASVTGSTGAVTYSYVGTGSTTYPASATKPTAAGTYNVTATVAADANYNSASSSATAFTIAMANSTVTVTGPTSFIYNGALQGPDSSTVTGSTGAVTYSYVGTGSTTYPASATKPTAAGTYNVTATVAADANYNSASSSATAFTINKATPLITWVNPVDITYPAALSATQLNATSGTAGSFVYNPAAGTVLGAGSGQNLSVAFTPTDTVNYNKAYKTVSINVTGAGSYAITAQAGANGTVTPVGVTNVTAGSSQAYGINASSGYQISDVQVDGRSVGSLSAYTFTNVNAAHKITATFISTGMSFTVLTASVNGSGGTISPSGSYNVIPGGSAIFRFYPDAGYYVSDVQFDGSSTLPAGTTCTNDALGNRNLCKFTNITGPHTVQVFYSPNI
jgi:hypothetical protein